MKKYDGDWGTIEIMKTCCKYRISNAIQNGERQPRDNYRHTARNSAKRNPNGLRGPKHGKAAKRRARDAQGTEVPPNSGSSITSIPSLSFDGMADSSDAQHQFEPLASNGSLSSPILQSPHVTHSYSGLIAHPAHVVDRRDDQPPLTSANHAQGMYGYHHQRLPHINLDQPLTGSTSQGSTTQVHLHHGQAIPNLAFMENMYRLKPDRTPSPFLHTNDAPGAGTRYDPRRD